MASRLRTQTRRQVVGVNIGKTKAVPEQEAPADYAASTRHVPLLVKIAPDLADEDIDAIADLVLELGVDGIIATNTTISRDHLASDPAQVAAMGMGGLSGAPLKQRALQVLRRLHARTGNRVVLIASGGIETADDAWERITAWADWPSAPAPGLHLTTAGHRYQRTAGARAQPHQVTHPMTP